MCLATAYLKKDDESTILAKNVSNLRINDDSITLTDIMGAETVVKGQLKNADLVNGIVEIIAA